MAEIVSSNVSNSLTDGYGRRSLNLSAAVVGGRGAGVEIGSVNRLVDRGILADRRLADASLGGFEFLVSTMGRVEDIIGGVGDTNSISARIVNVEAALIDAASDPSSDVRLMSLGTSLKDLANGLNAASRDIQSLRVDADTAISGQVDQLNLSLSQVEQLNKDITSARLSGIDPSGLMDQRQVVIDKIAEIVPIRELDRDNGQVALMTPSGETLLDDGIGKLSGGTLGAAFQTRDVELVSTQNGLDEIAADLISRFQNPAVDPTLVAGQEGLFTDGGAAYDPVNLSGLSGRISLNALVDPAQGGASTNLRDGLNSVTPGASGDATLLQALSAALSSPMASGLDLTLQSAAGRASNFEASTGAHRLNFEAELSFSNARWSSLKEAEAAGGVDTDYEMQMLLRVEQAYAANARVVQTVESLMQRLMEI
ncbi:Flagellar hook-associated protein 1 [Nymphon striatum]|nr:Flagellar hook-associated protein 1 [Nymphon striatum]